MKRTVVCLGLLLLLLPVGCARQGPEYWGEESVPAAAVQPLRYRLMFQVPEDCTALATDLTGECYEAADGSYTIQGRILPGPAESAVLELTGSYPDQLQAVKTTRMDMEEYRFCWCAAGETEPWLCRGDVLYDGSVCYCLCFAAAESRAADLDTVARQVMDSFGLYYDEGFRAPIIPAAGPEGKRQLSAKQNLPALLPAAQQNASRVGRRFVCPGLSQRSGPASAGAGRCQSRSCRNPAAPPCR